jgi:hypothetical protein
MDSNIDLSAVINLLDRKIADLNIKMVHNPNEEVKQELNKYLEYKKELYNGNLDIIKKILNKED